eukprot:CAMPEP_0185699014 /NCGR_PEP_ID=MMETSP1164-20130828/6669_1 /TAXON_ID=1104430 /ORGANISM="Chrysoreinhardia sp, Strain CCMP2950" /LENGTH=308 /DNA_ID=CAMNT_0028365945 /DNA_START=125 /DNA_END=1048 /DNA_ORIENTATION=+
MSNPERPCRGATPAPSGSGTVSSPQRCPSTRGALAAAGAVPEEPAAERDLCDESWRHEDGRRGPGVRDREEQEPERVDEVADPRQPEERADEGWRRRGAAEHGGAVREARQPEEDERDLVGVVVERERRGGEGVALGARHGGQSRRARAVEHAREEARRDGREDADLGERAGACLTLHKRASRPRTGRWHADRRVHGSLREAERSAEQRETRAAGRDDTAQDDRDADVRADHDEIREEADAVGRAGGADVRRRRAVVARDPETVARDAFGIDARDDDQKIQHAADERLERADAALDDAPERLLDRRDG